MKHSQKEETKEKLEKLLTQYREYQKAEDQTDKDRIGDEMTYADPIVWMMYKQKAYEGSSHPIGTLGELRHHSVGHGGICNKRMTFLSVYIGKYFNQDILNNSDFPDSIRLEDFYNSDLLNEVVMDEDFIKTWQSHEYFRDNGRVAKWQNFIV